jgi:hypothetical protein
MRKAGIWAWAAVAALALPGPISRAEEMTAEQIKGQQRTGWPSTVSRWARPSESADDVGYFVGGSRVCGGMPPGPQEGTWGWDYCGHFFSKRIMLGWGQRPHLGAPGTYKTDGPHPLEH